MKETPQYYLHGITEPSNIRRGVSALAAAAVGAVVACGGSGSADNPANTGSNVDASPSATLQITSAPSATPEVTPIPTETPKPYGPAPTLEDLLSSIQKAYGPGLNQATIKNLTVCLNGNETYSFDPSENADDALNLLSICDGVATHLQEESTGSASDINTALDNLRNTRFSAAEKFVQMGVLSEGEISQGKFDRVTFLYYKHKPQ